jgi:cephalosporin-C deacetylase-like acetyl esterase
MKYYLLKIAILLVIAVTPAVGQKQLKVLPWKSEQTVNTFLLSKLHQQYDARRKRLEDALKSPRNATVYRDSCRASYRRLLGELPGYTPLNAIITGTINQPGYSIEKIIYQSVPNHHVTANLYIPEGKGPFPGVLLFCGHENEAKATESYQKTAILFALNGFVVMVVDPISQAERHQITGDNGKPLTRGGTTEHTLINAAAALVGTSAVAYQLWDNVRALDYLETRQEVDKNRIGCLGNSGGGTQTSYLIAFDERIKVAAPCSYVASRERNFEWFGPSDGCQHALHEGEAGLEINDFLISFAPKPLLVLAGKYDFVDYYGTQKAYQEIHGIYTALGKPESVKLFTAEDGHGISSPKRHEAVKWFRKWMYHDERVIEEKNLSVLSEDSLSSTGKDQVAERFSNEVNDIERTRMLADHYRTTQGKPLRAETIKSVLKVDLSASKMNYERVGNAQYNNFEFERFILRKPNQMPVPVLVLNPGRKYSEIVIWVHEKGKNELADSAELVGEYLKQNKLVVLADISGVGELQDPPIVNDPKYYNKEYRNAMLAIHTGTSLPALRVRDILTVIDFVESYSTEEKIALTVLSQGICSLPALHAAALDKRISKLYCYDGIDSFYDVFNRPTEKNWYSYVIPGALKYYDVKDLAGMLGSRLVTAK